MNRHTSCILKLSHVFHWVSRTNESDTSRPLVGPRVQWKVLRMHPDQMPLSHLCCQKYSCCSTQRKSKEFRYVVGTHIRKLISYIICNHIFSVMTTGECTLTVQSAAFSAHHSSLLWCLLYRSLSLQLPSLLNNAPRTAAHLGHRLTFNSDTVTNFNFFISLLSAIWSHLFLQSLVSFLPFFFCSWRTGRNRKWQTSESTVL